MSDRYPRFAGRPIRVPRLLGCMSWLVTCLFLGACASTVVGDEFKEKTALTIYSTEGAGAVSPDVYRPLPGTHQYSGIQLARAIPGYAIVRQERKIDLADNRSTIRFSDVAAHIEPTTVTFTSLTDPDTTRVVEQNFEFDLVSSQKLMERFIGKQVTLFQTVGDSQQKIKGTLLSANGGVILQDEEGGVRLVSPGQYSLVDFPSLPDGLITRPTLVWDVFTPTPGPQQVRVSYETRAMTWWADYNLVFAPGKDANSGSLDVSSWVTIINQSGASYDDAKLKLIAGDVQKTETLQMKRRGGVAYDRAVTMAESAPAGFEEKSFFEYHLYTLGRPTTLPQNSTKQLELFDAARNVPCEKVLVYYGSPRGFGSYLRNPMLDRNYGPQSNKKVDIYLRFKNEEKVGLGIPLPKGRIRVNQRDDADGTLEFIGEDSIDHTPKDEEVLIRLGNAFDVVGSRRVTDFSVDNRRDTMSESVEIKVRNRKDQPVRVLIKENLYRWTNWRIEGASNRYEKLDARMIEFPVDIPAGGESVVTYQVIYSW